MIKAPRKTRIEGTVLYFINSLTKQISNITILKTLALTSVIRKGFSLYPWCPSDISQNNKVLKWLKKTIR